jgi:hypothetical protein
MTRLVALCTLAAFVVAAPVRAQYIPRDERGSRNAERKALVDANQVAITHFNYGLGGGNGEVRGNWPRGTDDFYLGDFQLIVGAEVMDDDGQTVRIVETSRSPRSPNEGPPGDPSVFWGFEAVPEYQNPDSWTWARSDDASTWPEVWPDRLGDASDPGWPGSWNGLLGKDAFIDGVELYSHYADDADQEFDYTPDPENPERGGLGLVVGQRVLAWTDPLLEDAVVYVYDIHNASPKPLDTAALGFVLGTLTGGDGDSRDDIFAYDFDRDVAYWEDADDSGNLGQPVGTAAIALLQTPTPMPGDPAASEIGMTGVYGFTPPGAVRMNDDDLLFDLLTTPGANDAEIDQCAAGGGCDGDLIVSAGPFALPAFSSQRVVAALAFGETRAVASRRVDVLRGFVRNGFSFEGGTPVALASPQEGEVFTGFDVPLEWAAEGENAQVRIDYSLDFGRTWENVVTDGPGEGSFVWNTTGLSDGAYQLRVVAVGPDGVGMAASGTFYRNVLGNAPPQVVLHRPLGGILSGIETVAWTADDGDGDALDVALSYRISEGPWADLATGLEADGAFARDTRAVPNSPSYQLRAVADDGTHEVEYVTGPLIVRNGRDDLGAPPTFAGRGTGVLDVRVIDAEALTGHAYRVVFTRTDDAVTYDVRDVTAGTLVLDDVPVSDDGTEGPLFDGLRLVVYDAEAGVDRAQTGWAEPDGLLDLFAGRINIDDPFPSGWSFQGTPAPYDYELRFDDELVGQSIGGFVLGTGPGAPTAEARATNFTVHNVTLDRPAPFVFLEPQEESQNGYFDAFEFVFLYEDLDDNPGTDPEPTYQIRPTSPNPDGEFPGTGDAYALRTSKPFVTGDAFRFVASLTVDAEEQGTPRATRLGAAFPNPLADAATLRYAVAASGPVRVTLYDVLGREVAVLVDEVRPAGEHTLRLDARRLASGVYLVRLDAAEQTATRRLTIVD